MNDAGVAYDPPRSSATAFTHALVVVFPNEPVIPTTSGFTSASLCLARFTKRRLSRSWIGLVSALAAKRSSGAPKIAASATAVPPAGATQSGAPATTATATAHEREHGQRKRDDEQAPRPGREDERLRLRAGDQADARVGEQRSRAGAEQEHEQAGDAGRRGGRQHGARERARSGDLPGRTVRRAARTHTRRRAGS